MGTAELVSLIFGMLTALLGGLNIFQLLTFRSYKRKAESEADKSEIDALRSIIDGMQAEIGRLQQRVADADKRALENANKYVALTENYYNLKTEFEQYKINHK